MNESMLITTQDFFQDFKIAKTLGLVRGSTVRSRNIGRNFLASIRQVFGGEIYELTEAVNQSREQALERMKGHAKTMGADAIVGVHFVSAELGENCSEIMCYGTAVKLAR